ncbi:MAG TPA: S1C family serine protease [Candidatus Limnocylindrales bacterium]|nr:S1C family serine protease [Candidatus Limnocylindrales bacterium]
MHAYLIMASLLFSSVMVPPPQSAPVTVKIRVLIVDKDLNQKPVPFYIVSFKNAANAPAALKTDLDGKAEKQLPPGRYTVSTPKPVELGGKRYSWNLEIQITGAEQHVDLTNDNARTEDLPSTSAASENRSSPGGAGGELTALFDKLKNSVVAIHSESGKGSGFLVDSTGLVVTNNHVVHSSPYLAVQFDDKRKVPARLVAANADKDLAVIRFDPAAFPEGVVAPLLSNEASSHLAVGQRVFTIGNPLGREKALTTGVVSKIEKDSINSDININPGNSGGPLFTLDGQVAGITTSVLRNLASIVPVEVVRPLVEQARKDTAKDVPPAPVLLPVEPTDYFPADALRDLLKQERLDTKPYFFEDGEFQVGFFTPPLNYYLRHEQEMAAARKAAKRSGGDASTAKPPSSALEDAVDYRPVLLVRVRPKFGAFFKVRFKNGFVRMRLLCGGKELTPILPGRSEFDLYDQRERKVDTTFQGMYEYQADAVTPACGNVVLEIYSEKDPNTPETKPVDAGTVQRVWNDFDPFRQTHPATTSKP